MSVQDLIQENIDKPTTKHKIEISLDNVKLAYKLIESAKGDTPTQDEIRIAVGGGSYSTIGKHIAVIKKEKAKQHELAEVLIPEGVEDQAKKMLGAVWQSAIDESERRLYLQREELKVAQDEVEQEVNDARSAIKTLESEAESQLEEIKEKEKIISDLNYTVKTKDKEFNNLVVEKKEMTIKYSNQKDNNNRLDTDLRLVRSDLKEERKKVENLTNEKIKNIKEIDRVTASLSSATKDLKLSETKIKDMDAAFDDLKASSSSLEGQNKNLETENKSLNMQQHKVQSNLDLINTTHTELKAEVKDLRKSARDSDGENGKLAGELKAATAQNKELKDKVSGLEKSLSDAKNRAK